VKSESTLHLIVVDDSSNDAEAVSNMLRNAGHAVRTTRAEDDEDLRDALERQSWDMILTKLEIPFFSALDVLSVVEQNSLDLPVIVLADPKSDMGRVVEALKAGARDAVSLNEPGRLECAVVREYGDLNRRRRQQRCEALLEEANARAQGLVESSRDAIAYVHDGMHIFANQSYLDMFGYSDPGEIEGMPILNMVTPEDHEKFKGFLRNYMQGDASAAELAVQAVRTDSSVFDTNMEFAPAAYEGENCIQIIIRDQRANKELEKKLDEVSKTDLLTGAFNRQFFLQKFEQAVTRTTRPGALLFIEPDNFNGLKQDLGIAGSDALLAEIANLLKKLLPPSKSLLARFEAHTFTALIMDVDDKAAELLGRKIIAAVDEYVADVGGSTATFTCGIGAALFADGSGNPQQLLERGEKALRTAQREGTGRFYQYNPAAEDMAEKERMALWTKQLKLALRENRFHLVYQPIVSLQGDTNENYEVFVRMRDGDGNEMQPSEFLPAAEKAGLVAPIDRWVLHHAVRVLADRREKGRNTNLFVKLSGQSLRDAKLLPWLRDLLKAAKLDGGLLTIEVSESVAQTNLKALKMLTEGLSQLRVRLAIDHFGLAPNSGNLLKHCNPDFVKIDGSIISGLAKDPEKQSRIRELTAMAKEGDRLTIGQTVEDAGTLATLWSYGLDYIQGHFLQEPSPSLEYDFSAVV
jgi:diguanylate cyclase (GGDEF)-like protein/PAS domain S-box-containing protein